MILALVLLLSSNLWASPVRAETALEMASFCRPVAEAQIKADGNLLMPATYETGAVEGDPA